MKRRLVQFVALLCMLCVASTALAGTIVIPASVTTIEEEAFEGIGASSVVIPSTTTRIDSNAFSNNPELTDVYLPVNAVSIADDAFDASNTLTFHVYMGSENANWASTHGYQIEYITGDIGGPLSDGWAQVNSLIANEPCSSKNDDPYYTYRLIVKLKNGNEMPNLDNFNPKASVRVNNNLYVLQFNNDSDTGDCAAALKAWGGCVYCEADYFLSYSDTATGSNTGLRSRAASINSDDPMGFSAYTQYLSNSTIGNVTIAVLDDGVSNTIGCTISPMSYDFINNRSGVLSFGNSHGTRVAGAISEAFGSLANHLTIISYRIENPSNGEISYIMMGEALLQAKADGAAYANISIAGESVYDNHQENQFLRECISSFGASRVIAAAGNHVSSASNYLPGRYCTTAGAVQLNSSNNLVRASGTATGADYSGYATTTSIATAKVTAALALTNLGGHDITSTLMTAQDAASMPNLSLLAIKSVNEIVLNNGDPIESMLEIGDRASIDYEVVPSDATVSTVTVTSSDENVVKILSNSGNRVRISAVGKGTATLHFTSDDGNAESTVIITVIKPVVSVSISGYTGETLMKGETLPLTATVLPSDASDTSVTWTSSNNNIATVDQTGVVAQVGNGIVTITATAKMDPSLSDSVEITVSNISATTGVTVTAPKDSIGIGKTAETLQMSATVSPADADQAVTWSVDKPAIATIDQNGLLTAVSSGEVIVTATSVSGNKSGFKGITVVQLPTSVSISGSNTVNVGEKVTLTATVLPENTTNKNVTWSSGNPTIASVNNGEVTGIAEGTAVIIATCTADQTVVTYYAITVSVQPISVSIDTPSSTVMDINGTLALSATVNPSNATNKTITWSTSDSSVATVSSNGVVTAKASGAVTITAKTVNNKTSTVTLTVRQPYTLNFNANGGSCSTSSWTCYSDYAIGGTLPTPTRTGYTFAGWYTAASGGSQVTTSTKFTSASSVTIYAHWTAITYTITFNANGGSVSTSSKTVTYDGTYGTLATPTRTGYTCNGWYTSASGGTKITDTTKVTITSNQTLYAHWTANTYTVTYNANGGSVSTTSKTVTYDSTYGTLATPTRDYNNFTGWYTAASGGTKITDTTKVTITSAQTLYAHWELKPEKGWIKASDLPSGAQVTQNSWSYRESTESTSSTMSGWTSNGNYWKQTGSGSTEYATFPSTYKTSNQYYTSMAKEPYTASETTTSKREVQNTDTGYIYWHWMYSRAYDGNSSGTAPISSKSGNVKISSSGPTYNFAYFYAIKSTTDCPYLGTGYCCNQGIANYDCRSIIPSNADKSSNSGLGTYRFFRFKYSTSTYTDYTKMYKYYKDYTYASTDPGTGSNISNKVKYVKYREK